MDLSCALEFADFVSANNCLPDFVNSYTQDLFASEQIQNCFLLSSMAPFISFAVPLDLTELSGAVLKSRVDAPSLSASTECVLGPGEPEELQSLALNKDCFTLGNSETSKCNTSGDTLIDRSIPRISLQYLTIRVNFLVFRRTYKYKFQLLTFTCDFTLSTF